MGILTILFWIFVALWCTSAGVWLYTIINKRTREKFTYFYPFVVQMVCSIVVQVIAFIIKLNT